MPTFRAATAADRKPPRLAILSPDAFASSWKDRPDAEVAIGLIFISGEDVGAAKLHAMNRAIAWASEDGKKKDIETFDGVYNEELIYFLVSRGATDANDIAQPYFPVPAEDTVRQALTPQGARRLWDELQLLHLGVHVGMPVAGDDEVRRLAAILARGKALQGATAAQQLEARKLIAHLLEQLGPHDPEATPEDADTDDGLGEEEGVYTVVAAE